MARYEVLIKPSAVKEIEGIPQKAVRRRITSRIESLADDPRPPGCEKLTGQNRYRVGQGAYRIVYSVKDDLLVVFVVRIGHRSQVYR